MIMEQVQAKKLGVLFSPPTLILLYKKESVYKKLSMPVRELSVTSDCSVLAARLQARHKKQLSSVNIISIEKMIRLIQEVMKGHPKSAALEIVRKEYELNPEEDLNRLSDKELKRRKAIMDLKFQKNSVPKDHPDFVYDKEVDFSTNKKVISTWDSSEEDSVAEKNPPKSVEKNLPMLAEKKLPKLGSLEKENSGNEMDLYPVNKGGAQEGEEDSGSTPDSPEEDKIKTEFLSELTRSLGETKPLGPAKPLLEPLSGKGLPKLPLHKALPPLDLSKLNRKLDTAEDTADDPDDNAADADADDDIQSDNSFSDDSDLLPAPTLNKAIKAKALFGLDSDEEGENEVAEAVVNAATADSAVDKENDGKDDATPRSISVGDVDNNEEDDFW